jgi:K+-transporting ATPase ATPase B chain
VRRATLDAFRKLDPRLTLRNPVMFVVEVGAAMTTVVLVQQLSRR